MREQKRMYRRGTGRGGIATSKPRSRRSKTFSCCALCTPGALDSKSWSKIKGASKIHKSGPAGNQSWNKISSRNISLHMEAFYGDRFDDDDIYYDDSYLDD